MQLNDDRQATLAQARLAHFTLQEDIAFYRLRAETLALKQALNWYAKANFNPNQPRDWQGRWADTGIGSRTGQPEPAPPSWRKPSTLNDHFKDHGKDFGALTKGDYAKRAEAFLKRAIREKLPMTIDTKGYRRVYDARSNTFGVYDSQGRASTFYKPPRGAAYFQEQIDTDLKNGGRLVNPNTQFSGPSARTGGTGRGNSGRGGGMGGGGRGLGGGTFSDDGILPRMPWDFDL